MNAIRVSVTVSGTDAQGEARSFVGSGTIYAQQMVDNTYELDGTPAPFNYDDRGTPLYAYIENQGTVDIAYAVVDGADDSTSFVVPPGGCTIVSLALFDKPNGGGGLYMWTASGTATVRYILFY